MRRLKFARTFHVIFHSWIILFEWSIVLLKTRKQLPSIQIFDLQHSGLFFIYINFIHPSQNCYSCPFSPVWVSTFPWNSADQEWSPDFLTPIRGSEHLATTARLPARVDTKRLKSDTTVARIRIRDALSTVTFFLPQGLAQNKIQLSHPGWEVLDKAEGLRHRTQGHLVSGLFPGEGVAHQRNHAKLVVP